MPYQLQLHSFADLWHPGVLAWTVLMQAAYLLATGPMRLGYGWGAPVPAWQKLLFSLGLWSVYLSEGTPLHILAERYLFSAHMLQHQVLTMVVPPLLLLGTPHWMARPLFGRGPALRLMRFLTRPVLALLLFNAIYSIWHMPIAYQATLWWHGFHMFQHAVLFSTAILLWWPVVSPLPELPRPHEGVRILYVWLVGVAQVAVFGLITFADGPIYAFYELAPRIWHISPLADQQIAGVIMKMGGMAVAVLVFVILFFRWAAREQVPDLRPPAVQHGAVRVPTTAGEQVVRSDG